MIGNTNRRRFLGALGSAGLGGVVGLRGDRSGRNSRAPRVAGSSRQGSTWERRYGSAGHDFVEDVVEADDGGFVFAGTYGWSSGSGEAWVAKVGPGGNMQWDRTFGDGTEANALVKTGDGGYVFGGIGRSGGADEALLVRLADDGTTQWRGTYGGDGNQRVRGLARAHEGGYVLAGGTSVGDAAENLWVAKVAGDGTQQWERVLESDDGDWANGVAATSDGSYLVAGRRTVDVYQEAVLLKLAADGSTRWLQTYDGTRDAGAASVIETSDGGYLFPGKTELAGGDRTEAWLVSVGPGGERRDVWRYPGYGYTATAESVREMPDGGYLFYGATAGTDDQEDFWMGRTAPDGTLRWERTWGSAADDFAFSFVAASDGGYLLTGNSERGDTYDVRLLKYPSLPEPTPTPTPTRTPTETATDVATDTATTTTGRTAGTPGDATSTATGTSATDVPGFGILGTLAGMAGAGYLWWRRSGAE